MKEPAPRQRLSILPRLILIFSVILALLLALCFGVYRISVNMLESEIRQSIRSQNEFFAERFSDEFMRILSINHMLSTNPECAKLAILTDTMGPFEKAQAIASLKDKLYLAKTGSQFIQDISLYIPRMGRCITTNASANVLAGLRILTKEISSVTCDQIIVRDGRMIVVTQNSFHTDDPVPSYVILIELSLKSVNAFLDQHKAEGISKGFMFAVEGEPVPAAISADLSAFLQEAVSHHLQGYERETVLKHSFQVEWQNSVYTVFYVYLRYANVVLVRYFHEGDINTHFERIQAFVVIALLLVLLLIPFVSYMLSRTVHRPLRHLVKAFERVREGNLDESLDASTQGEFQYIFQGYNTMLQRLRMQIDQNYKQKILMQRAELNQLQAQIDPHFLYNSLFILNKRIRAQDTEGALSFSQILSQYFAYSAKETNDQVALSREVDQTYTYIRIQQVRFDNRMKILLEAPPAQWQGCEIPRLTLQPICENVFKHVIDRSIQPVKLHVTFKPINSETLEIHVTDSGAFLLDETVLTLQDLLGDDGIQAENSGILNVHRRLQLFFGTGYGVSISRGEFGGLHVVLRIGRKPTALLHESVSM